MKKVKTRATAALLIAALLVAGVALYLVRLADDGGAWATYFTAAAESGTITDRNGTVLYRTQDGAAVFSDDWTTRLACYHAVGDLQGRVGTGALAQFRARLSGYNFVTGTSSGKTLALTLDADLNRAAYTALAGRSGAVLVMDYTTGEILCMVSSPADDPASPSESPADGTYLNKCLSATYVPGSIFKLVTLAAAIENISDLYTRSFTCAGSTTVDGSTLTCSGTHGQQTIEQALANSCNVAFGGLALELGADTISEYADRFGLTGAHSLNGIETAAGTFDKAGAGTIDLAWSGIGQYHDLVSPFAMLRLVAAIANGGELQEPTLLGKSLLPHTTRLMAQDTADKIADMMNYNVENEYGTWNFPGLSLCAKTGTAETGTGTSHAWFVGFLQDEAHPYAFVVLVENAGAGLKNAGPVANAVLQAAVNG